MNKSLIISRYNEDLDWLKQYKDFEITVYNKGYKLPESKSFKVLNLENVGRESHTWLYHIVHNYNKLNNVNIFLQGRIDDLDCMAYRNPNDYLRNINKIGFTASRYGMLGPLHWRWNVGVDKDKRYKKNG